LISKWPTPLINGMSVQGCYEMVIYERIMKTYVHVVLVDEQVRSFFFIKCVIPYLKYIN